MLNYNTAFTPHSTVPIGYETDATPCRIGRLSPSFLKTWETSSTNLHRTLPMNHLTS